jgi:hypothetical protein
MEILSEDDKHVHAKFKNCYIYILLRDVIPISVYISPEEYNTYKIIHINDFECDNTLGEKGNGRQLLVHILEYIKKKPNYMEENLFVTLQAVSKIRKDSTGAIIKSDDEKLISYYEKLGFSKYDRLGQFGIMAGVYGKILMKSLTYRGGRISRTQKSINQRKQTSRQNRRQNY